MNIKKVFFILITVFTVTCLVVGGKFWWTILQDPQRPEFATPIGIFISGPEAQIQKSMLSITWTTADEYQINSIYFKKRWARFPDSGHEDVGIQYDAAANVYHYTAQFELGLPATPNEDGYAQYIEPGSYTYQVWGNTTDYSKKITSPVIALDI